MAEAKDPGIKLFGRTILVPEVPAGAEISSPGGEISCRGVSAEVVAVDVDGDDETAGIDRSSASALSTSSRAGTSDGGEREDDEDKLGEKPVELSKEDAVLSVSSEKDESSRIGECPKTPSAEETKPLSTSSKTDEQGETCNSQERSLKKPDKILPCPRCNSMETKFCYYNNYNVNQPRHFCKNCQRYWTAGGSMRNVPVGAGRRKNKNSASHCRQITISEALQNGRSDIPNGFHHPSLKQNGTVLTFGSDTLLCESMASVLNLVDKKMRNGTTNGFGNTEDPRIPVYGHKENGDNHSTGSLDRTSKSSHETGNSGQQEQMIPMYQGAPAQFPCFPGSPWPLPWNLAQWNSPVPLPAFCPPGLPMPFYPTAAYWSCTLPGNWNIPWLPQPSAPTHTTQSSGPNSPTLGKHSRDENTQKPSNSAEEERQKENNTERCLWIPKTLRIDDPEEAARSSIWATLGIKNEKADSKSGKGMFRGFESKGNVENHRAEPSPVLQVNPAALSRSVKFHESS